MLLELRVSYRASDGRCEVMRDWRDIDAPPPPGLLWDLMPGEWDSFEPSHICCELVYDPTPGIKVVAQFDFAKPGADDDGWRVFRADIEKLGWHEL